MIRLPLKYINDRHLCIQAFFHCGPTVGLAGKRGNFLFTVFIITTSRQNVTKAIYGPRLLYSTTSPVCIFASTTTAYVIIYFTPFYSPLFLFAMSFIQAI